MDDLAAGREQIDAEEIRSRILEAGEDIDPRGFEFDTMLITGDLDLSGFRHLPRLAFKRCVFGGALLLDHSNGLELRIEDCQLVGLSAQGLVIRGDLLVVDSRATETVDLTLAHVQGRLDVLQCDLADVDAARLVVESYFQWTSTSVEHLGFSGGEFRGPESDLNGFLLSTAAHLDLTGASFASDIAIGLPTGSRGAPTTIAELDLAGVTVAGDLSVVGSVGRDLRADGLRVEGHLDLRHLDELGEGWDPAKVRRELANGRTAAPAQGLLGDNGVSVDLRQASIGRLSLPIRSVTPHAADLTGAMVGTLDIELDEARTRVESIPVGPTREWQVDTVMLTQGDSEPVAVVSARRAELIGITVWLPDPGNSSFTTQPWNVVAEVLEEGGRDSEARALRIEAADRSKRYRSTWLGQVGRVVTKATIGHGYASWRALGLVLLTCLVTLAVAYWGDQRGYFTEVGGVSPAPGMWAPLYSFDLTFSPISTGQGDLWGPSVAWFAGVLLALKTVSWILLGLFASGISGLVSRRTR